MPIIEINNLEFSYDKKVSDNIFKLTVSKWQVEKGNFLSILGPNGCGKSTLLKLIAGLFKPNLGSLKVYGHSIEDFKRDAYSKIISYVPQSAISIFPFSVYEIVMMGRTPHMNFMGFDNKMDRERVRKAIDIMELNHLQHKSINEISGGEAQRVFIARAIAQQAEIILLDEPSSHLDLHHQIKIFDLLKKLSSDNGLTIITVTHDLNLVGIYSKEVVFMNEGKIIIDGEKKMIFTKANIKRVFNVNTEVIFSANNNNANVFVNPQS